MDVILKVTGKLAKRMNLGGSPKDALSNIGGALLPLAGVIQALIQVGWLPAKYQPLVVVLPSIGGLLMGGSIGRDQNLNPPVKISE